jgi:hypothetical protein
MTSIVLKSKKGTSLVEVMVAMVILIALVVGAVQYRYYATLDARKAAMQRTAATIGLLLCENWRGVKGTETYDPTAHLGPDITIIQATASEDVESEEDGFILLGRYTVILDDVKYYATLSWKDVKSELRALNVIVAWAQRYQGGGSESADKLFKLTTYVSM